MLTSKEVLGSKDSAGHLDTNATVVHVDSKAALDAVHYVIYKSGRGHIWLYKPLADPEPLILLGVPDSALSVLAALKIAGRHFDLAYSVSAGKVYFEMLNAIGG